MSVQLHSRFVWNHFLWFVWVKSNNIKSIFIGLTHLSTCLVDTVSPDLFPRKSLLPSFTRQLLLINCIRLWVSCREHLPYRIHLSHEAHSWWLREECKCIAICAISEIDNYNEHMWFRYSHWAEGVFVRLHEGWIFLLPSLNFFIFSHLLSKCHLDVYFQVICDNNFGSFFLYLPVIYQHSYILFGLFQYFLFI